MQMHRYSVVVVSPIVVSSAQAAGRDTVMPLWSVRGSRQRSIEGLRRTRRWGRVAQRRGEEPEVRAAVATVRSAALWRARRRAGAGAGAEAEVGAAANYTI
jgi:hypothetical protein